MQTKHKPEWIDKPEEEIWRCGIKTTNERHADEFVLRLDVNFCEPRGNVFMVVRVTHQHDQRLMMHPCTARAAGPA